MFSLISNFVFVFLSQSLGSHILFITRPQDKKKVLFYNDKDCQFKVDEGKYCNNLLLSVRW